MNIQIRRATHMDVDGIAPLFDAYRIFYEQKSDLDSAKRFIANRLELHESIIFIAIDDMERILGFTQLFPSFSSVTLQRSLVLNDLYVLEAVRGSGVGRALLEYSQSYAQNNKYKGLALETERTNPAQKLYEKLGWEEDLDHLFYYWKVGQLDDLTINRFEDLAI